MSEAQMPAITLTPDQIEELRGALEGTMRNVYSEARARFGANAEEEVFDQLRQAGLFKCEECSHWKPVDEEDGDIAEVCQSCTEDL